MSGPVLSREEELARFLEQQTYWSGSEYKEAAALLRSLWDENEALKHDIARHVEIASKEATRAEELSADLEKVRWRVPQVQALADSQEFRATAAESALARVAEIANEAPDDLVPEEVTRIRNLGCGNERPQLWNRCLDSLCDQQRALAAIRIALRNALPALLAAVRGAK